MRKFIFSILVIFIFSNLKSCIGDTRIGDTYIWDTCIGDTCIDISLRKNADFSLIDDYVKKPFFLGKLTVNSDLKDNGYSDLIDLKENSWISSEDIKRVCFYLKAQGKFNNIKIELKDYKSFKELKLTLYSRWTFSKVKIKGLLLSKDKYKQYYLLMPGDVFRLKLHQKGISKIKDKLQKEGFLNAEVTEHLNYNKYNKTVDVDLFITKSNKFTIKNINLNFYFKNKDLESNCLDLKEKIENRFLFNIKSQNYNIETVNLKISEIKKYLISKGFWDTKIDYNLSNFDNHDNKDCCIDINFNIAINQDKKFVFFGNYALSTKDLLDKVLLTDCLIIMPPLLLKEELERTCRLEGYWDVNIRIKEEIDKIFFIITEGQRAKISKVKILNKKNNIINFNWATDIVNNITYGYYQENFINKSLQKLVEVGVEQGYWDCKIIKKSYNQLSKNNYELNIVLDCGQLSKVNEFIVKNYSGLESKLYGYKELPVILNSKLIKSHKEWLKNYFDFKKVNIVPELIKDKDKNTLVWNISLDKSISKFGKTIVLGDNNINNNLILKELEYKEKDIFDQAKIDKSINRLKSWGIFDQIYLLPYESDFGDYRPLILNFVCDDPFELRLCSGLQYFSKNFAGYGGITYKFGGSFLWKNITKNADVFDLSLNFTRYSRRFFASYKRPWIYGLPFCLNFKVYSLLYDHPLFFGSSNNIYKVYQNGFNLKFRHLKFDGNLDCNIGFEVLKTFDITPNVADAIDYSKSLINKPIPYIYCEPNFFYSSFDNSSSYYNTWGITTLLSLKGLLAFKETQTSFFKFLLEQSLYLPIFNLLGAFRIRLGHIVSDNIKYLVPTERFYLGGSKTVRGYEPWMVPPLSKLCLNNQLYWVPTGAKSVININSEIRFPIYKAISGVFFNDMGLLSNNKIADIKNTPWQGATGVGFRYNTLLGPLRFDIGFKWHKKLAIEKSYVWYFTLGQAF